MELAALRSLHASNTGYGPGDTPGTAELSMVRTYEDAARQVISGNMTVSGAAAMIGSNKNRAERAAGFGTRMAMVERAVRRVRQGQQALTSNDVLALKEEAVFGSDPGSLIGARHETYAQLAPMMLRRYQHARQDYTTAQQEYEQHPVAQNLQISRERLAVRSQEADQARQEANRAQERLNASPGDATLQAAALAAQQAYDIALNNFAAAQQGVQSAQLTHDNSPEVQDRLHQASARRAIVASNAAALANIYQYASYASEQKGRILADGVMGQAAYDGANVTVQQDIDTFRGDAAFTAQRQEFAQRNGTPEEMAARIRNQGGGIQPPTPVVI